MNFLALLSNPWNKYELEGSNCVNKTAMMCAALICCQDDIAEEPTLTVPSGEKISKKHQIMFDLLAQGEDILLY